MNSSEETGGEPKQGSPDHSIDDLHDIEAHPSDSEKGVVADDKKDKDYLLGGRPPLKTICDLSAGPIVSQLINALYGIVTTFYISMAIGDRGLSAVSTYAVFDSVGRSFGFFLSTSASATISALFGAGKEEDVHQLGLISLECALFLEQLSQQFLFQQ